MNRGSRDVGDAVTVFCDDDLEIDPASLQRLVATVAIGTADVAAPRIVDAGGHDEGSVRALPTPGRLLVEWARHARSSAGAGSRRVEKWRRPTRTEPVDAFDAALVAVRTERVADDATPRGLLPLLGGARLVLAAARRRAPGGRRPRRGRAHAGGRDDVRADKQRLLARNAVRCVYRTQGRYAAGARLARRRALAAPAPRRRRPARSFRAVGIARGARLARPRGRARCMAGVRVTAVVVDWLGRGGIAQTTPTWVRGLADARPRCRRGHPRRPGARRSRGARAARTAPHPFVTHRRLAHLAATTVEELEPDVVVVQNYVVPVLETPAGPGAASLGRTRRSS